jgi:hypothetical protein
MFIDVMITTLDCSTPSMEFTQMLSDLAQDSSLPLQNDVAQMQG